MKSKYIVTLLFFIVINIFPYSAAYAALIKYTFSGRIIRIEPTLTSIWGSRDWSATFYIDDGATNTSSDPLVGEYNNFVGDIFVGGKLITKVNSNYYSSTKLFVANNYPSPLLEIDTLGFLASNELGAPLFQPSIDGIPITTIEVKITDNFSELLQGTSLSDTVGLAGKRYNARIFAINSARVQGSVDNISSVVLPTPIPSSFVLFVSGLIIFLRKIA